MSLEAHAITVGYDDRPIIENVSIAIAPGEVVGLCGPSGAGKTTLARALTGLIPVNAGRVTLDAEGASVERQIVGGATRATGDAARATSDAGRTPIETRRGRMTGAVTMLFQSPRRSCSPRQTLGRLIAEPLAGRRSGKLSADDVRAQTDALCREVGLTSDLLGRLPAAVSDGQLQKAALARALATDPAYLICDEATSMLDALTTASVIAVLRRRVAHGLGILAISHDRELLAAWADPVLELTPEGLRHSGGGQPRSSAATA